MSDVISKNDDITNLRQMLFETMRDVRAGTLDTERAKVINGTAQTIINSAKVEVDYVRITGAQTSNKFLEAPLSITTTTTGLPNGITSIRQHRLLDD